MTANERRKYLRKIEGILAGGGPSAGRVQPVAQMQIADDEQIARLTMAVYRCTRCWSAAEAAHAETVGCIGSSGSIG
jgi:hypothetical protein